MAKVNKEYDIILSLLKDISFIIKCSDANMQAAFFARNANTSMEMTKNVHKNIKPFPLHRSFY